MSPDPDKIGKFADQFYQYGPFFAATLLIFLGGMFVLQSEKIGKMFGVIMAITGVCAGYFAISVWNDWDKIKQTKEGIIVTARGTSTRIVNEAIDAANIIKQQAEIEARRIEDKSHTDARTIIEQAKLDANIIRTEALNERRFYYKFVVRISDRNMPFRRVDLSDRWKNTYEIYTIRENDGDQIQILLIGTQQVNLTLIRPLYFEFGSNSPPLAICLDSPNTIDRLDIKKNGSEYNLVGNREGRDIAFTCTNSGVQQ